jgi:hypothetical protein
MAVPLPEAGHNLGGQFKSAHPFHAFPEAQVRHDETHGATVIGGEWLATALECGNRCGHHKIEKRKMSCDRALAAFDQEAARKLP